MAQEKPGKFAPSDHCNGEIFFNPGHTPYTRSFAEVLKWQLNSDRKRWPKMLDNRHIPELNPKLAASELNLTFVNHATVYVQTPAVAFLTDPVWSKRTSPFSWLGPARHRPPGCSLEEIPRLDFILLSHNHYDHLDEGTLRNLAQRFQPVIFLPLGLKSIAQELGFQKIVEMDWWQDSVLESCKITFLPAQHWSGRWIDDRNRTLWGGFQVDLPSGSIFFAGDSGYGGHFSEIRKRLGPPGLALLPIGAYEPRWFMKVSHMNPDDAVRAHLDLQAKQTMAIHFGTWQLTDEGIDDPVNDLNKAIAEHRPSAPFFVLQNGESRRLVL